MEKNGNHQAPFTQLTVECEDCKQRFEVYSACSSEDVGKVSLNYNKEFKVHNGKSIFLTYFDCPSCGRRHYVQIDNATSIDKLNKVKKMFIELSVMKHKGKEIPKKQLVKFKKARQHLSDYRMILMKEYTGKLIRSNDTEPYSVLRFSI